ncbi:MAG: hypothetical protein AUK55_09660 [Syntrophobacteraceae bacterium CG2_30_61_12]|nr:MAG: hypothetical protein AUK55_09660 [Syntrophobacteraceae bacterium CG2_30_61_12]
MYLTTMTHRDELFDLALRWLNDDVAPGDGRAITRIFLYESAVSAVVVNLMIDFLNGLFNGPLQLERIRQKQVLRRRLIQYLPQSGERVRQLIGQFERDPEYFFPRLPIDALLVTSADSQLAAIGRIKRLSRVAEKVSFRLVEALFREIQAEARRLAATRAAAAGVSLADLISSEQEMQGDFTAAEATVAGRFRSRNVVIPRAALTINDLLGFKIIGAPELLDQVPALLDQAPGITLVESEKHAGNYNAVNMLVEIKLPKPDELTARLRGFDWSIARRRGLDPAEAKQGFMGYLAQGADTVRMEIILTTYDELMESEFGRSMHELRILRLRQRQNYSGPIAQNAAYLIEYLLALASSPTVEAAELPIKMYGRYLPETIANAKCALYGTEIDGGLLDAFCLNSACLSRFCSAAYSASGLALDGAFA